MRRLCVFYKHAHRFLGKPSGPARKPIEWIVCKGCQRKLQQGIHLTTQFEPSWQEIAQQEIMSENRQPCAICLEGQHSPRHHPGFTGARPHPYVPLEMQKSRRRR